MRELGPLDGDVVEVDGRGLCARSRGSSTATRTSCFAGDRVDEFDLRAGGATLRGAPRSRRRDPLDCPGDARRAAEDALRAAVERHRGWMLAHGTTTFEGKSGYGLDRDTELAHAHARSATRAASRPGSARMPSRPSSPTRTPTSTSRSPRCSPRRPRSPRRPTSSSSGARSTPPRRAATSRPAATPGSRSRLHADQFTEAGGIELAIELGARSVDHLEATGDAGRPRARRRAT